MILPVIGFQGFSAARPHPNFCDSLPNIHRGNLINHFPPSKFEAYLRTLEGCLSRKISYQWNLSYIWTFMCEMRMQHWPKKTLKKANYWVNYCIVTMGVALPTGAKQLEMAQTCNWSTMSRYWFTSSLRCWSWSSSARYCWEERTYCSSSSLFWKLQQVHPMKLNQVNIKFDVISWMERPQ